MSHLVKHECKLKKGADHVTYLLRGDQQHLMDKQGRMKRHGLIAWCRSLVPRNKIFVDVGAHMGTFTMVLAAHCKAVHAFEPSESSYRQLGAHAWLNHAPNVRAHCVALGEPKERGTTRTLHVDAEDGTATLHHLEFRPSARKEAVQMACLDDYAAEFEAPVGLLKVRVGGHELQVLRGALKTIRKDKPRVLFECAEIHKPQVFRLFNDLNFQLSCVNDYATMFLATPP